MGLVEAKELVKTLVANAFILIIVTTAIMYLFAKITYKKAHKNTHKVYRRGQNKTEIVFNIGDTSKMTLPEIQALKGKMRKELIENV